MTGQPLPDGRLVKDSIIPVAGYVGLELRRGQTLPIVDAEGRQVPDLVCFNVANLKERLSTNNSRLVQKRWLLTTGHALYSDEGNPMLRIVDDSIGVQHASAGTTSICGPRWTCSWRSRTARRIRTRATASTRPRSGSS